MHERAKDSQYFNSIKQREMDLIKSYHQYNTLLQQKFHFNGTQHQDVKFIQFI